MKNIDERGKTDRRRAARRCSAGLALAVTLVTGVAASQTSSPVSYSERKPTIEALPAGSLLSRGNHEKGRGALPDELLRRLAAGELEIRIQETTDLAPSEAFLEATHKHAGQPRLAADGSLEGYVAGTPFPVAGPTDPRCGLEAAWNLRHHDHGRGTEAWGVFRREGASGRIERRMEFHYALAYGMHRWPSGPAENPWAGEGVLYKEFYRALAPLDVRDIMNLKLRYDDERRSDENWSYLPAERKVRKIPAPHEEATMGTDLLREDYGGFSGYVHAHEWRCLDAVTFLAPVGIRASRATLNEHRYPIDAWEPRELLVVEAIPRSSTHPYGRRVLYLDRQTWTAPYVVIFDRSGAHAKTLFTLYGNPRYNPGNEQVRVPVWLGETVVNHRDGGATITDVTRAVFDTPVPESLFTVEHMLSLGR